MRKKPARSSASAFLSTFLVVFSSLALGGALAYWYLQKQGTPPKLDLSKLNLEDFHVELPGVLEPSPKVPKVIYLNREGADLTHGFDDSTANIASLVPKEKGRLDFPAYTGSITRWRALRKCVKEKFKAFDVQVVDRRPVKPGYIMVMIGGTANILGKSSKHHHAAGLAPFNGRVIKDAVVFAFSAAMRNDTTATCETIGMEVAHAYGLDHAMHCSDLMTYLKRCGTRRFLNKALKCGEHKARKCAQGGTTQNSHAVLLDVLGPAKSR